MTLFPEFQRAEASYARLRAQYDAGAISAEQFRSAVEAQMVQHEGAYWVIGVDSGQWFRHDGREWQETLPPVAPPPPSQPAGPSIHPPQAAAREPQPRLQPQPSKGRNALLVPLVVIAVIAVAGGAYYLGRSGDREFVQYDSSGDRVGSTNDSLVELLVRSGIPRDLSQDWRATMEPELSDPSDPEPGEVGKITASLQRSSDRSEFDYQVTVFEAPDSAQRSYEETTTFDMSRWSPEERDTITRGLIHPPGMTAQCLSGSGQVTTCHAIAGRSIVFTFFRNSEPSESAIRLMRTLVDHVTAVERGGGQ